MAAVLTVREQTERTAERMLSAVNAELQQMRTAHTLLERELADLHAQRAGERNRVTLAAHIHALVGRHEALRAQQAKLRKGIKSLEARRTEQQALFLAARREREMVTQLREKHEKAWQDEQQRGENKRLDDLFSARRARALQAARRP